MEVIKVQGLVVSSTDYGESDKLIRLATVELGKITAKVKGCKKAGAKLRFAAAPFLFGEYVLSEKSGFYVVTSCQPVESFIEFSMDLDKFYRAAIITEFLDKSTRLDDDIKDALLYSLKCLRAIAIDSSVCVIEHLVGAFKILGYELNLDGCTLCGALGGSYRLNFADGGLVCPSCSKHGEVLSLKASDYLIGKISSLETEVEREILIVLGKYFTYLTGAKLNSLHQYATF